MTKRKYYGQNGEDCLLWAVFDGQEHGWYVEVGAFDGVYLSNTLSFEQQGWAGVCCEAHPFFFPLLQKNRPGARCEQVACVGDPSLRAVSFLMEPLGLFSGVAADQDQFVERNYRVRKVDFPGFQKVEVPASTLEQVLQRAGAPEVIDLISVDVEGSEVDVLRGLERPARVIVAEANSPAEAERLEACLAGRGYRLCRRVKWNYFFARDEADARVLADAVVRCRTENVEHPLGVKDDNEVIGRDIVIDEVD
jgi:FkbM family methyltransferase